MRAVILAAGRGSRMNALTQDRPKCFVTLGGKTLLERQLEALEGAGLDRIAIVTGYKAEVFTSFARTTFNNSRWAETNMVVSLAAADDWLAADETIVSYSDIFYSAQTVRALAATEGPIAIAYDPDWFSLWKLRFDDPASDAESFVIDASGRLLEIGKKHPALERVAGQYMGLLKFTPHGWKTICGYTARLSPSQRDRLDMTSLLAGLLESGETIVTAPVSGRWGEVDSERDLRIYQEMLEAAHG